MALLESSDLKERLIAQWEGLPVLNTHCHHLPDAEFASYDLDKVLTNSYVDWFEVPWDKTFEGRARFLDKVRHSSFFCWLQKGLQQLYACRSPLTTETWDTFSGLIADAHRDRNHHLRVMTETCRYVKAIQDAYWDPGSNNGHPEVFPTAFRINSFLFGYSSTAADHDGANALVLYSKSLRDLDDYLGFLRETILTARRNGAVALKLPAAYDRGLDFAAADQRQAAKALRPNGGQPGPEEIKAFQDFVVFEICRIAAELEMPLQCHTGMGLLERSNALWLQEAIKANPGTQFVLLHCSYPWTADAAALCQVYPNVYPDLAWLPLLSPSVACATLRTLIEAGVADRICWGCDTWTPEESCGALAAVRDVLAEVLVERVRAGWSSFDDALDLERRILFNNAAALYRLPVSVPEV
jgi:hypothetical protein